MNTTKVIKRFSNCIPVKGYCRSMIYDLQRIKLDPIPNALYEILTEYQHRTKDEILDAYNTEDLSTIKEYLDFLEEKEHIFFCNPNEISSFPELQKKWDFPGVISNAVIENAAFLNQHLVDQLSELGVNTLVIVLSAEEINTDVMINYSKLISETFIDNLILLLPKLHEPLEKELISTFEQDASIARVMIYDQQEERSVGKVHYLPNPFSWNDEPAKLVAPNIPTYMEALDHSLFYNRKLFINEKGEIANTFQSDETYGHINNTPLVTAIEAPGFKRLWNITKDKTDVCKDCELRYVCLDKRIPIQRQDGSWFHTTNCDYNPYIAKWKGENGYSTLSESGITTDITGHHIDTEKIKMLEQELWG